MLKVIYEEEFARAAAEDGERTALRLVPTYSSLSIKMGRYASGKHALGISDRSGRAYKIKDMVKECEKFAEDSPYPDKSLLYDAVYEQKDYPFLKHKL